MDRYIVVDRSELGHCCISSTVVDTEGETWTDCSGELRYKKIVCECCDDDDAQMIAYALNR